MARPRKQDEIARWLKGYLAQGARPAADVMEQVRVLGWNMRTLKRAKETLGVESVKRGRTFFWRDPNIFEEQTGTPSLVEAIRDLTRAIRQLQTGQLPVTIAPSTPRATAQVSPATPVDWSSIDDREEDLGKLSLEGLLEYSQQIQEDLPDTRKYHGQPLLDHNDNIVKGQKIDNSEAIRAYEAELDRIRQAVSSWSKRQTQNPF